ncbi:MAG: hypothetical protein WCJ71_07165 [Candidatus Omnitrophota bacterium]
MKDIPRAKYIELRKKVRWNVWANSREVMIKKYNFLYSCTVMGGVVLEKRESTDQIDGHQYPRFELKLFDFSGVFELHAGGNEMTPAFADWLRGIREGDVIFGLGRIFFDREFSRLVFFAVCAGFEHDFVKHVEAHPKELAEAREATDLIRRGGFYYYLSDAEVSEEERKEVHYWTFRDLVMFDRPVAIRSFLRLGRPMEHVGQFLNALHSTYSDHHSSWIPDMIVRYFKKQVLYGSDSVRTPDETKRQFFEWYPDIKPLVEWPGTDIQDLRLKEKEAENS